jgi:outer membrane lipoprotein LolB
VRGRVAAAAILLLVGGCAAGPRPQPIEDESARREALQALAAWTLSGRFAVAAGNDGFSGGLQWQQRGSHAELALRGPMGGEAIRMHVDGADYVVETPDGASYDGERAQRLLAERIGAVRPLPVQDMRYWLLGVPAPGTAHEETLGTDQRLASLTQSGWLIRYGSFENVGALALPQRIEMTTQGLRLRVVVSDWQLPP